MVFSYSTNIKGQKPQNSYGQTTSLVYTVVGELYPVVVTQLCDQAIAKVLVVLIHAI